MEFAYFGNDNYGEGRLCVNYTISQDVKNNYTDVSVSYVDFQSLKGRYTTWEIDSGDEDDTIDCTVEAGGS